MKSYLITDPKYYSNNPEQFAKTLQKNIQKHLPDMVCFRDKESKNIEQLIATFIQISRKEGLENIFINSYLDLAIKYKAKGIHLTSTQFDRIALAKSSGLEVVISCHTTEEIIQAIKYEIDYITYSPIFPTPNKGEPKGIEDLKNVAKEFPIKIIALGGIVSKDQIQELEECNVFGFASIRYFV